MAGGHGGQAVVRGPARRGGARQQSGHLLVEVRAHGPEQEELMVGERPVLPAAEQAQRPQGLTVADNAVLEGVIDLKGLIERSRFCSPTRSLSRKRVASRQQLSQAV